jgi:N-acetylmuramoyl-L-alanine amidase
MEAEHKKLLINNFSFIGFFALLFICYCTVTSWLVGNTDLSQSASLDVRQKKVIVIDPGHGGEDGGAIGINGTLEKDLNLLISDDLSELFQFAGYEVIPTRTEDIMLYDKNANHIGRKKILDLAARLEIAKNATPDLFVGIHMNSFPQEKYSGLTVYYSDKAQESSLVAEALHQDVRSYLQPDNNREIKSGRNIYLLERASYPAILVECGFLSNRQECELLSTEEYRQKLTFVIFSSLASFLEETKA